MTEPTNHYTQLSVTQRARLFAFHGEALNFARYAQAAQIIDRAERRIAEIKALAPDASIALDASEAEVLGINPREAA